MNVKQAIADFEAHENTKLEMQIRGNNFSESKNNVVKIFLLTILFSAIGIISLSILWGDILVKLPF